MLQRLQISKALNEVAYISVSVLIYVINRKFLIYTDIPVFSYLCQCHLNDFLCGGVFISYINLLFRFGNRKPCYSLIFIIPITLVAGIFWEYVAPLFLHSMVSDFWDVAAYLFGSLIYTLLFRNVKIRQLGFRKN